MPWPIVTEDDDLFDTVSPNSIINKIRKSLHQRYQAICDGFPCPVYEYLGPEKFKYLRTVRSKIWPLSEEARDVSEIQGAYGLNCAPRRESAAGSLHHWLGEGADHFSRIIFRPEQIGQGESLSPNFIYEGNRFLTDDTFFYTPGFTQSPESLDFPRNLIPPMWSNGPIQLFLHSRAFPFEIHDIHDLPDLTTAVNAVSLDGGVSIDPNEFESLFRVNESTPENQYKFHGKRFTAVRFGKWSFIDYTGTESNLGSSKSGYAFRKQTYSLPTTLYSFGPPKPGDYAGYLWVSLMTQIQAMAWSFFLNPDDIEAFLNREIEGWPTPRYDPLKNPIDYEVYLETRYITDLEDDDFFIDKIVYEANTRRFYKKLANGVWARQRFVTEPSRVYRSEIPESVTRLLNLDLPIFTIDLVQKHIDLLLSCRVLDQVPMRRGSFVWDTGVGVINATYDDLKWEYSDSTGVNYPSSDPHWFPVSRMGDFSPGNYRRTEGTSLTPGDEKSDSGIYHFERLQYVDIPVVQKKMFVLWSASTFKSLTNKVLGITLPPYSTADRWVEITEDTEFNGKSDIESDPPGYWFGSSTYRVWGYIEFEFDDA